MKPLVCLLAVLLLTATAGAATIHVPADQSTIQAGIDAATAEDTVLVAADTYSGPGNREIDFGGKNVYLESESGAVTTIIDCLGNASEPHFAFSFHNGEDSSSVVEGFTIQGAYLEDFFEDSAAVFCFGASPTFRNCVITGNSCSGVRAVSGASPRIEDCVISDNDGHGVHVANMLFPMAGIKLFNSLILNNTGVGVFLRSAYNAEISNCTMVGNGQGGFVTEGDPPKDGDQKDAIIVVSNCISAYNQGAGFERVFLPQPDFYCNDAWGNSTGDWQTWFAYAGDTAGNMAQPPLFCDQAVGDFSIHSSSPCAPANNSCGVLMGAYDIGCSETLCGDVNGDGMPFTLSDMVYLARYIFGYAPAIAPWQNSDLDVCNNVNISDLARYIEYFANGIPEIPCTPVTTCYPDPGEDLVRLDCVVDVSSHPDFVPVPILISNQEDLAALSLGFKYNSDDLTPLWVDLSSTVLPVSWTVKLTYPGDTAYAWPVADSNMILLVANSNASEPLEYLGAQEDGLLATVMFSLAPGADFQSIDIDTSFVPPAGEFAFSPASGGTIKPAYSDCGTSDIIYVCMCGDADGNGVINISDAVCLISYVFTGIEGCNLEDLCQGDADGNNIVNISDAVYLIAFVFGGGDPPHCP
jgi:hypothetical protein